MLEFIQFLKSLSLNNLPISILVSLVSGYLGYWFAYHGNSSNERHEWMRLLVFSSPVAITLQYFGYSWWLGLTCLALSIFLGTGWRKYGRKWLFKILNYLEISNEDGSESVLTQIGQNTNYDPSRIFIWKKDGKRFGSLILREDKTKHSKTFTNTFILNKDGIAMYIDYIEEDDFNEHNHTLTYFPMSEIARIEFEEHSPES